MKQALEEATAADVTVPHPHHDPHGIQDVLRQLGVQADNAAYSTGRAWGGAKTPTAASSTRPPMAAALPA